MRDHFAMAATGKAIRRLADGLPGFFSAGPLVLSSNCFAGTGDPAGVADLLFLLVIGGTLLAVALSLVFTAALFRGRVRIAAFVIVLAGWIGLYHVHIGKPASQSAALRANYEEAIQQCKRQLAEMPMAVEVDGILDEGAGLRKKQLLQLLSDRKLNYVEVKTQALPNGLPRIAYQDGPDSDSWNVRYPQGTVVRIELGKEGDTACLSGKELPSDVASRLSRPPFLPGTCMRVFPIEQASAQYVVRHSSDRVPKGSADFWELADRKTGATWARLSTTDSPEAPGSIGDLSARTATPSTDCRAPYSLLMDRLVGQDQSSQAHPQLVTLTSVLPVPLLQQIQPPETRTVAVPELTAFDEADSRATMHPRESKPSWKAAVEQARATGWSGYGDGLLDWRGRRLITLSVDQYPWKVSAGDRGFFVRSTREDWHKKSDNLLVHYDADGRFVWATSIDGKSTPALEGGCRMSAQAMTFSEKSIWLQDTCRVASSERARDPGRRNEGIAWRVARKDLPKQ